jgi:outer membrane protein OmpA-like peptidoglycan-associated protein
MKTNKLTYLLAIGLVLTFVATGCKHKPPQTTPIPDYAKQKPIELQPTQPVNPGAGPGSGPGSVPGSGPGSGPGTLGEGGSHPLPTNIDPENMNQLREILAANTVHFAFDSSAIRSSEQSNVQAVAAYLKSNPNDALLVEGHCDERGTEEYNRALGERRALALREALIASGGDGGRIVTRSYGKDKRIALGNDEASHAQNRRGEFVVLRAK